MLLLDAAAVVDLLLRNHQGELVADHLRDRELATVAHLDAEVFSALARKERDGELDAGQVAARLTLLGELDVQRLPIGGDLLAAAWGLRHNVAARDALYVAAAVALGAPLLTTDRRLVRAAPDVARHGMDL